MPAQRTCSFTYLRLGERTEPAERKPEGHLRTRTWPAREDFSSQLASHLRIQRRGVPPETAALRLLEQNMATHKFAVGQALHFSPGLGGDNKGKGRYKVVRQLPETGGIFQYRIKSEVDGHERVVREDQTERRS